MSAPELVLDDAPVTLYRGDCREVMALLPDASVDSIVTDPPYELGFMGKGWDSSGIAYDPEVWTQAFRVLKPGGHALVFGGTRTWHRVAVAIEDAGFEIRDSFAWMYGSGFPKSMDVAKAIDKTAGTSPVAQAAALRLAREAAGLSREDVAQALGASTASVANWEEGRSRSAGAAREFITPGPAYREKLAKLLDYPVDARAVVARADDRRGDETVIGLGHSGKQYGAPSTSLAQLWEGWGTAVKPAFEPIVVARKPLAGTVAANVLAHGTGALNIGATRIGEEVRVNGPAGASTNNSSSIGDGWRADAEGSIAQGRFPSNVLLDESQAAELDRQSGVLTSGKLEAHHARAPKGAGILGAFGSAEGARGFGDSGGASRFFYVAKAGKDERPVVDGHQHATVKPLALMRYLVRMVTQPGGTVLEPFAGSGTTLEAAVIEGFNVIGAELDSDGTHIPLILKRLSKPHQQTLFGDVA